MSLTIWEPLFASSDVLQLSLADWAGSVSCHIPSDPRFQLLNNVSLSLHSPISSSPIPNAVTLYVDGSKTYGSCVWKDGEQWHTKITPPQTSAQRAELAATILALQTFPSEPFNLILDSLYVYKVLTSLSDSYVSPSLDESLLSLFLTLQSLLHSRSICFFPAHIRSHQPFPGIISEGNAKADAAASAASTHQDVSVLVSSPITPWDSHSYFHQNKKALMKQFSLTATEAAAIIQQCPTCSLQAHSVPQGVNPRGTQSCQLWQMDVTQYLPFAPWKYLHVSIDTYSGFIMATPQRGESAKHVINHCIRTFSILGNPKEIKTDNGPAYTSTSFAQFCNRWSIVHKFGIPYNSTGQAIVERANQTVKRALDMHAKKKGENTPGLPGIQNTLNLVLFTLNFLNVSGTPGSTAASRHFSASPTDSSRPQVYYRRLPDPTWKGPASLITWGRGYAAIDDHGEIIWTPARCVRPYMAQRTPPQPGI